MRRFRTVPLPSAVLLSLALTPPAALASAASDYQARLAQTVWCAQQTEAILRTLPHSSIPVSAPDGLASYAALLSENVAALNALASFRDSTDEQRKAMGEGLHWLAGALHDQSALAANRGLTAALSMLSTLEEGCRSTLVQLSAAPSRKPRS